MKKVLIGVVTLIIIGILAVMIIPVKSFNNNRVLSDNESVVVGYSFLSYASSSESNKDFQVESDKDMINLKGCIRFFSKKSQFGITFYNPEGDEVFHKVYLASDYLPEKRILINEEFKAVKGDWKYKIKKSNFFGNNDLKLELQT